MAKISKHGGPTIAEEVAASPGNSSETLPEKPSTKPKPSGQQSLRRARMTGSRSEKGREESSTAPSTAGSTPETGTAPPDENDQDPIQHWRGKL